jgi:lipid A 3-O-deacylase
MASNVARTTTCAILFCGLIGVASAGAEERPSFLHKGRSEWGLTSSFGSAHEIWGGAGHRQFVTLGVDYFRVMSDPHGPGFLRGSLALNAEALPLFVMFQEQRTYGFGTVLQARYFLDVAGAVVPFFSAGAGVLLTNRDTPPDTSRLNFMPQVGAGVAIVDVGGPLFTLEYRLHHISNAGLADWNPGINSSVFQFGINFPIGKQAP